MNGDIDFFEWLGSIRLSRKVCMLIPMEACMGFPVVVRQGTEYILPFFKTASAQKNDILSPPFAYLRVSFPAGDILTYNHLRTLPEWRNIDWNETVETHSDRCTASELKKYYEIISRNEPASCTVYQQDARLCSCLHSLTNDSSQASSLVGWYQKLIDEAKKYR